MKVAALPFSPESLVEKTLNNRLCNKQPQTRHAITPHQAPGLLLSAGGQGLSLGVLLRYPTWDPQHQKWSTYIKPVIFINDYDILGTVQKMLLNLISKNVLCG